MSYASLAHVSTGELATAALHNTLLDNVAGLRVGEIATTSQAANEVIFATSATQLGRSTKFTFDGDTLMLSSGADGPSISITNGTRPCYVEFEKSGYTGKGSVGLLGSLEMNLSFNMDYADNVHRFYDSGIDAYWLTLGATGMTLQYAPAGASADIYNTAGHDPLFVSALGGLTLKSIASGSGTWVTMERTGGTASKWRNYLPSGSTDLRWFSGTDPDSMILQANGVLRLPNVTNAGSTTTAGLELTGVTAANLLGYKVGNAWLYGSTNATSANLGANTNGWTHTITGAAAQFTISGSAFSWASETSQTAGTTYNPTEYMNLSAAGVLTVNALATGTLSSVSGVITSSSDERLKSHIRALGYGLAEVLNLRPIRYRWNQRSGLDRSIEQGGFGARQIERHLPLAVSRGRNGMRSLNDRVILAAVVAAIQEQHRRIVRLEKKTA